jgi:hypothetical protein
MIFERAKYDAEVRNHPIEQTAEECGEVGGRCSRVGIAAQGFIENDTEEDAGNGKVFSQLFEYLGSLVGKPGSPILLDRAGPLALDGGRGAHKPPEKPKQFVAAAATAAATCLQGARKKALHPFGNPSFLDGSRTLSLYSHLAPNK